jgi:3-oxoacyl-[acyl-carrier protein] reductase
MSNELKEDDMSNPSFEGKVAVVTGGSKRLGARTAAALVEAGARVVVSGRDVEALASVAGPLGDRAIAVAADVTKPEDLTRLREATESAFGPCDVLMAFAGGLGEPVPSLELPLERFRATVDANLTGTFLTVQAFAPGMAERGRGAIVTMASTAGRQPSKASIAYAASKAGVVMLTRQFAQELAPRGVRVNCLAPSSVRNERMEHWMTEEQLEALGKTFPLGRIGEPEDVADAALFLASERAGWITGVVLDLTGGRVFA